MDPVTGLSRRQLIALAVLIPLGIVASTVATAVSENVDSACPDESYECASLEPDEPLIVGLVAASEQSTEWPFRDAIERGIGKIHVEGRPVEVDIRLPGCSAEAAAQDARELVSDPPDEPPAAVVIGAVCEQTAAPMAQILSDTGTTFVALNRTGPVPTDPPYHLVAPKVDLEAEAAGLQGIGLASHLRELIAGHVGAVLEDVVRAIDEMAIVDGKTVLIPRTPLRDSLVEGGYPSA